MAGISKVCSVCDADLNGKKRIKDKEGTYFCPTCWEARKNIFGEEDAAVAPAVPSPVVATREKAAAARPTPVTHNRIVPPGAPAENVLLKKLGFLAAGVGAIAFFDLWPMYQASQHVNNIMLSMKGIFLGWLCLCIAIVAMLPESIGVTWVRPKDQPASPGEKLRIKILFGTAAVVGFVMAFLTTQYIENQGYKIGF